MPSCQVKRKTVEELSTIFNGSEEWNVEHLARHIISNKLSKKTFSVLNLADLVFKCENWKQKMPRVRPFYAVKCNNNKIVLQILAAFGFGFDCASDSELEKVLSLGISPKSIIYAHATKPQNQIEFAREKNVDLLTFDSEFELIKIKEYFPKARLMLRIKNDALVATNLMGVKFGCCPDTEAPHLLSTARELNLDIVGVCFHVGTGCEDHNAHAIGIAKARKLFDLGKITGHNMNILDIGGGFAGDVGLSIDKVAAQITKSLDEHFPEGCGVNIIAEPGRYFVASAFTLACCIHSSRVINHDNQAKTLYFMDNGIFGSFAALKLGVQILDLNPKPLDVDSSKLSNACLFGPTCAGLDVVMENVMLPVMPIPSWLLFESFGAYTSTLATDFNGFSKPDEYVFSTKNTWDLLCEMKGFDVSQINFIKLPVNLPKKLQYEELRTKYYSKMFFGSKVTRYI